MKRALFIVFLFGISLHAFPQKQSSNDEVSTLKSQVTTLRQTNSKLSQDVRELKLATKAIQDSLAITLKMYDSKMNALQDSLKINTATVHAVKSHSALIDHSLRTRKTLFYISLAVIVVLLIAMYFLSTKMQKSFRENLEMRIVQAKDKLEIADRKLKDDLQVQLAALNAEIISVKEELARKTKEAKK